MDLKKLYEGTEKLDNGLYRIRENIQVTPDRMKKLPLQESNQNILVEGTDYKCRGAYTFNIWEVDKKNLNQRIYTEAVCQKVINEGKTTLGLADHPSDDGSVKNIWAVERNPRIEEGWLKVDHYLVGDHGQLVNEVLEAGGSIGVSSSALGQLNEKTGEVLHEDFDLERYSDHVMNPSNGYANTVETQKTNYSESINNNSSSEEVTIVNKNNIEEKITMDKTQKLHEKSLTLNIKGLLKEAKAIDDVQERLESLEAIMENFDDAYHNETLESQVKGLIESAEKEIKELAEKGKTVSSLNEKVEESEKTVSELQENVKLNEEKVSILSKALEEAKTRYQKVKSMLEKQVAITNGMIDPADLSKFTEKVDTSDLEKKNAILERERDDMVSEIKKMKEAIDALDNERSDLIEAVKKSHETLEEDVEDENEVLEKDEFREATALEKYYKEALRSNPSIKNIKKEILESKTVSDAQIKVLRYENLESERDSQKRFKKEQDMLNENFNRKSLKENKGFKVGKGLW